jgi:hypothetical protein
MDYNGLIWPPKSFVTNLNFFINKNLIFKLFPMIFGVVEPKPNREVTWNLTYPILELGTGLNWKKKKNTKELEPTLT